nr:MAG TPA: hypothetical protein [Caudoviricetes sp.]
MQQREIVINKRAGNIALLLATLGYVVEWVLGVHWLFSSIAHAIAMLVLVVVLYLVGVAIDAATSKEGSEE